MITPKMENHKVSATTFLLLILCLSQSPASVFHVELDGSGDYTNIQPAVDASASGDTIMIGSGRWDTLFEYQAPGWLDSVIVAVDDKDLTLIGSGPGETIIGLTELPPTGNPGPIGIMVGSDINLVVKDLTIENMRAGLYCWLKRVYVENVHFMGNWIGTMPYATDNTTFQGCLFESKDFSIVAGARLTELYIKDCAFSGIASLDISIQAVEDVLIEGCDFYDGIGAVQFDFGSYGVIKNCVVYSGYGTHFITISGSEMVLLNNRLIGGMSQLKSGSEAILSGSNNVLLGADYQGDGWATIFSATGYLDLHENHIIKNNAEHTVKFLYYGHAETKEQHLENNYWGTAELDSIEAWIWNEDDDPDLNIKTYLEPFYDHPIPNETSSMGKMKSLFR